MRLALLCATVALTFVAGGVRAQTHHGRGELAGVFLRSPVGRLVKFEFPAETLRLAPVEKPAWNFPVSIPYGFQIKHIRDLGADEEVVQIVGHRYIGNNTSVSCFFIEQQADHPFHCAAISWPSAATQETLFVLHHTSADTAPERAYIRTPGGKWVAFSPFQNTYGDNPTLKLVEDMTNAYNFEIWRAPKPDFFSGP